MTFAIVLPGRHPSRVTCDTYAKEWRKSHPEGPHRLNPPMERPCLNPKPAEVRIEVGPCEACGGDGFRKGPRGGYSQEQGTPLGIECPVCHGSGDNEGRETLRALIQTVLEWDGNPETYGDGVDDPQETTSKVLAAIEGMAT